MSDGGRFPWKMQRIVSRPTANYRNLRNPLPNPPDGMTWHHDTKTKEWSLVPVDKALNNVEDHADLVDSLPGEARHCTQEASEAPTDDWEVLSDRVSNSSNSVLVPQSCGSVRSIPSLEANESSVKGVPENSSHQTELLLPSKIQRTANNSTIDSSDNALGPSGKGVLGVDYVEHVILPTDTFQGICLAYKIHGTRLRQANGFSGNSLGLAPPKLLIPLSKKALQSGFIRVQDTDAKEYKLHAFLAAMPNMSMTEAKAYLEMSDWVLGNAVRSAKEDNEWEDEMDVGLLKAGEIRFSRSDGYQGAGIRSRSEETISTGTPKAFRIVPIAHEGIPEIASYSVKAQDIYHAAPQHNNFGVELQSQVNPGSALI